MNIKATRPVYISKLLIYLSLYKKKFQLIIFRMKNFRKTESNMNWSFVKSS